MLENLSSVTAVVPTNRPQFLVRWLTYFEKYAGPLQALILDSSEDRVSWSSELKRLIALPNVTYMKFKPDFIPIDKMAAGALAVKTPYAFYASDDDFILPQSVS